MFSKAYEMASGYTRPVIISKRLHSGVVIAGCATFIVLNKNGWVLTAGHVLQDAHLAKNHAQEISSYRQECAQVRDNPQLTDKQKRKKIAHLPEDPNWITNLSYWWANDQTRSLQTNFSIDPQADIAVGKLTGIENLSIKDYPVFANPKSTLAPGTSLCRLGFPFHQVKASFDDSTGQFRLEQLQSLPMFPNDGIHTRIMLSKNESTGREVKFIETSTPGLRGQSGGPIFDVNGHIWAIQNQTLSLPLGFTPKVKENGKTITEHQFMHIGVGCHVEHVLELLEKNGVEVSVAS